ncbi:MAG TPA: substrate-binding domain-containing protein [Candidatus Limnocylindrales bacterium]|jgi:ribose transport system substrate-binding protein
MVKRTKLAVFGMLAGVLLIGVACAAPGASPTPAGSSVTLGYSNAFGVGNGFREEQLCTAKAEALVKGVGVSTWTHAEDGTYPQLQQLTDLIAKSPDAIIFNPNSPDGYQAVLDQAQAAGIKTIAIDAYVTDKETWNISNDQFNYGYVGANWLFKKLGGQGNVYYMRGIVGHPADLDRHDGVMKALSENPGIHLLPSNDGVGTDWNPDKGTQLMQGIINDGTYDTIDGIWTSGIDQQVVDAIQASGKPFVPVVGADLKGFVEQLLHKDPKYNGLEGIAVYNPASIGGAGVNLALKVLNGESPATTTIKRTTADGVEHDIKVVLLPVPEAYANDTADGMAKLEQINVAGLNVLWPVSWSITGWTDYTLDQMLACKGPGEP